MFANIAMFALVGCAAFFAHRLPEQEMANMANMAMWPIFLEF
jgi:hypothetical protein